MEELSVQQQKETKIECTDSTKDNDEKPTTEDTTSELDALEQTNSQEEMDKKSIQHDNLSVVVTGNNLQPSKTKESSTGMKVKRKSRSTRRRLNAMINNTSLHFSDTDSEGELTTIKTPIRTQSPGKNLLLPTQQGPSISVTLDDAIDNDKQEENPNSLLPDGKERSRRNSFIDNLTDVDEIYPSEPENDPNENQNNLSVAENVCQGDTDLEDFEGDDEVQSTIYVKPRSDIFYECGGETIITKEGDGPFSVEIRNKIYSEENSKTKDTCTDTPGIVVLPNTDEEDIDISSEEDVQEACCSQKGILEELDVSAACQIVMKNINKMENMLNIKDTSDEAIGDSYTDTEEVEEVE